MVAHSKDDSDQVSMIAACLANNFLKPLYDFYNERNYVVYTECLSHILEWSYEFYEQHSHMLTEWKTFELPKDYTHNNNRNEFLIAWGHKRIEQFFSQNEK
jgi:hypothetical protein